MLRESVEKFLGQFNTFCIENNKKPSMFNLIIWLEKYHGLSDDFLDESYVPPSQGPKYGDTIKNPFPWVGDGDHPFKDLFGNFSR